MSNKKDIEPLNNEFFQFFNISVSEYKRKGFTKLNLSDFPTVIKGCLYTIDRNFSYNIDDPANLSMDLISNNGILEVTTYRGYPLSKGMSQVDIHHQLKLSCHLYETKDSNFKGYLVTDLSETNIIPVTCFNRLSDSMKDITIYEKIYYFIRKKNAVSISSIIN